MKLKRTKKGFTIIELVIVIAVIGILAAVLIPTFVNLTNKANEAADNALVNNLNKALKMEEQEPGHQKAPTLEGAIKDLEDQGYLLENLASKSGKDLLWSQSENQFLLNTEGKSGKDYWKIVDAMPAEENQKYSYYAGKNFKDTNVTAKYGFDAGRNDGIAKVTYKGTGTAQEVAIRTKSYLTAIAIDAANDEVAHYGRAKNVDVIRVKQGTYDEHGDVLGNIRLARGKVNIAKGGSASDVQVVALVDADNITVTPTNSTVAVSVESGADLNTVTNLTENVSIQATGTGASEVHSITPSANAIAYTEDGEITTLAALGTALQGTKKVTLLADADLADPSVLGCDGAHRNCLTNPIKVSVDFDLNGFTAYVLHMGFVVDVDDVEISNGTIYTAKTNYASGVSSSRPTAEQIANNQAISSYSKTEYDRYGVVIQGDNVVLAGLKVYGGVSLGGDKGNNVSYTPVNSKGTNSAYNTNVIGCDLISLDASFRKSIYAQSGSNGALIEDTTLTGGSQNQGLLYIVGGLGDMGSAGDKNELSFKNVKCNVNPLTETTYSIGGAVQFEIVGSVNGTRNIVAKTGYASSNAEITYDGTYWYLNGALSYTIH